MNKTMKNVFLVGFVVMMVIVNTPMLRAYVWGTVRGDEFVDGRPEASWILQSQDDSVAVRLNAIQELGHLKVRDQRAADALTKASQDSNSLVATFATNVLRSSEGSQG